MLKRKNLCSLVFGDAMDVVGLVHCVQSKVERLESQYLEQMQRSKDPSAQALAEKAAQLKRQLVDSKNQYRDVTQRLREGQVLAQPLKCLSMFESLHPTGLYCLSTETNQWGLTCCVVFFPFSLQPPVQLWGQILPTRWCLETRATPDPCLVL